MNATNKERFMYILGALVFVCAVADSVLLIFFEVPAGSKDAVMLATGQLLILAGAVVNYFFGSSKSSSDKNEMIAKNAAQSADGTK